MVMTDDTCGTPLLGRTFQLDRFNVHRCPTRRVFSGTGIELMTCLPWLDTLTTGLPQPPCGRGSRVIKVSDRGSRAQYH
ncbi:hypothetical protein TNCV_2856441 [Trichonephila clavipes]|nr:hypothetical protein TNCV_2856441 [Trichonephila clavipes]